MRTFTVGITSKAKMLKSQRRSRRRLIRQNQHTAAEDDSVDFAHIVSPQKYCSTFADWKT